MQAPLHILFADDGTTRVEALIELLRAGGDEVERVTDLEALLEATDVDALVVDERLADGGNGVDLCESLRAAGSAVPFVFVARDLDLDSSRRLDHLGAVDVVAPFDPERLVRAVRTASLRRASGETTRQRHFRRYSANEFALRRAVLDLAVFLEDARVAPAHVARVSCAAAEAFDNVLCHAFAPDEEDPAFTVEAEVRRTSVRLWIRDHGVGFDAGRARLDSVPAALPRLRRVDTRDERGLTRIARLSEGLLLSSSPRGSTVELAFGLSLSAVAKTPGDDSSTNVDAFHPRRLRALVTSLRRRTEEWQRVPPALTLTLNRLLGEAHAPRDTVTSS